MLLGLQPQARAAPAGRVLDVKGTPGFESQQKVNIGRDSEFLIVSDACADLNEHLRPMRRRMRLRDVQAEMCSLHIVVVMAGNRAYKLLQDSPQTYVQSPLE